MIKKIVTFLLIVLLALLSGCGSAGYTEYQIKSAWAENNDLYILYKMNYSWGFSTLFNIHGTSVVNKTDYFYQKLDKLKIKSGDVIDLRKGTSADDLIYVDSDFLVERMRPPYHSDDSRAKIETHSNKPTVLCKGGLNKQNILRPIRFGDKLIYCGYVFPIGGGALLPRVFLRFSSTGLSRLHLRMGMYIFTTLQKMTEMKLKIGRYG